MTTPETQGAIDWELIHAYEQGLDDGFFSGTSDDSRVGPREDLKAAYERGYLHGVWMYCEREVK